MPSFRKTATLSLAAAIGLAVLAPASTMAQGVCVAYAKISLKQQKDNVDKRCGFTGPQWSPSYKTHLSWCSKVPPNVWKNMAKSRAQQLTTSPTCQR